jgi:hypothetical protein
MSRAPAQLDAEPIAVIFEHLVLSVREKIERDDMTVDLDLYFRSISIERKGIFFRSSQKESSAEVRLVTRIRKLPE